MALSPLSTYRQSGKKDDEYFANHLQVYVSKTFTKAIKSAYAESTHPMSSKTGI